MLAWLDHARAPRVIVGVGLAIRLVALALLAGVPITGDAGSYFESALLIARGTPYEPHWPPGLPAFIAAAFAVFGERPIVARVLMLFVYLAFSAAVLAAGKRSIGPRATNLALAFFAIRPIVVWSSVSPLTQLPTAALALGVAYFADEARAGYAEKRKNNPLAALTFLGLCLGAMMLTRPSSISVVALVLAYLAWRTRRWQTLVVPLAVIALMTGAWSYKAYRMTGRFVFINNANSQNIFYGNNPWTPTYRTWWYGSHKEPGEMDPGFAEEYTRINALPPKERDKEFTKVALDHIRARPDLFLYRTFARVRTFGVYDTFASAQIAQFDKRLGALALALDALTFLLLWGGAIVFPFARRAGLAVGEREGVDAERTEAIRLIALVAFAYAGPYFVTFSHPTFNFAASPLVCVLGCGGLVALLSEGPRAIWRRLEPRNRIALAVVLACFLLCQIEWTRDVLSRGG